MAVSVTEVPDANGATQVTGQPIPAGDELTLPAPAIETLTSPSKVAVTLVGTLIVTLQPAVPVHPPDQPVNAPIPPGSE